MAKKKWQPYPKDRKGHLVISVITRDEYFDSDKRQAIHEFITKTYGDNLIGTSSYVVLKSHMTHSSIG